jgi:hypothetical protein
MKLLFTSIITLHTLICIAQVKSQALLKEGDILFQNLNCGPLCDAIEAVTNGVEGKDFSHCALVVKINDTLRVIEAIGKGVQINTLHDFYKRSGDTSFVQNITVGRLKEAYANLIPRAIDFARKQIDQPYDDVFILNNGKWYCSELIYESFKSANNSDDFFGLEPMTYKDPGNQSFFSAWIDYYQGLSTDIPEGKLGTNPGLISRSDKILIID